MPIHRVLPALLLALALPAQQASSPRLFGRVVDEQGEPVAGAEVTTLRRDETLPLWLQEFRYTIDREERTVQSDDRGQFSIELARGGVYGAFATKSGELQSTVAWPVVAGEVVTLVARKAHRWTGLVVDASGGGEAKPVAGAQVLVLAAAECRSAFAFRSSPTCWILCQRLRTDDDGRFGFTAPRRERIYIVAHHHGHVAALTPTVDPEHEVPLTFEHQTPVHGLVTDAASGAPVRGALVTTYQFANLGSGTHTDADGRFVLTPALGIPLLVVDSGAHRPTTVEVDRAAGSSPDSPLRIELAAGRRLTVGLLRADGTPIANAPVIAMAMTAGQRAFDLPVERRTDDRGRVSLQGVTQRFPAGALVHVDGSWVRFARLPLAGGRDLGELRLDPSGRVAGRVRGLDGSPAARAPVFLQPLEVAPGGPAIGATRLTFADVAGRFEFRALLHRRFAVASFSPESRLAVAEVAARRDPDGATLVLERGETIRGVVRLHSGKLAAGALIRAYSDPEVHQVRGFGLTDISVVADSEGRFTIPCVLDVRSYELFVTYATRWMATLGMADSIAPGTHDAEITLPR